MSWVSRVDDARESLMRSHRDLIIVDEAHKMSAYADRKTLAYQLGEDLSQMTDHFLLMTATPHKGDPKNFCLFLELLDRDVYGDVKSLEEAMRRNEAPFYLRRTKEALVTFPDPETGVVEKIFTKRDVQTVEFRVDDEEAEFYFALTRYVEDQSIKAQADESPTGQAIGFTMAMLQRRFASSVYAVRRTLERMRAKRQKILDDPVAYRREQIARRVPPDLDDLPEDERQEVLDALEEAVASADPATLAAEIKELDGLIARALLLEEREVETKLLKLKEVIAERGIFADPRMKLLVFTEHKDTLDYLVGKLRGWGLAVTQIHGGMKIGGRDEPGTRLHAEREFRDEAQVLVATEAAGEGINLQFCWFMINYDIPWNPVRLEQRMGRIHRYGQKHDCLILNFAATNTSEGRVLRKLLERLRDIRRELGTDQVFDVVGEIFPANQIEKLLREMYVGQTTVGQIESRIVRDLDVERFRTITASALEGLAKRDLNLSALVGRSVEARERRLVPEVVEDFFVQAAPLAGLSPKAARGKPHVYALGRVPRTLQPVAERLEPRFGTLGREYRQVVFDKALLAGDATSEWVTPGHPLFEAVREDVLARVAGDLERGAVFYDLHFGAPYRLDVFTAAIKDGRGQCLHQKLFVVRTDLDGTVSIKQPTVFLDLATAPSGTPAPVHIDLPDGPAVEAALYEQALTPFLAEVAAERARETATVERHIGISLNTLLNRQNQKLAELVVQQEAGNVEPYLAGLIKQAEDRVDELFSRFERRKAELARERECAPADLQRVGRAWVLPHPDRDAPGIAPMVRDEEIERRAVEAVIAYEAERGRSVKSVELENRGFDLVSRRPQPEDPTTSTEVRFIEVKGRAGVGEVALTTNEHATATRLKGDYWLYVVFNCATTPQVHPIQDPARLDWEPLVKVEHYHAGPQQLLAAVTH